MKKATIYDQYKSNYRKANEMYVLTLIMLCVLLALVILGYLLHKRVILLSAFLPAILINVFIRRAFKFENQNSLQ